MKRRYITAAPLLLAALLFGLSLLAPEPQMQAFAPEERVTPAPLAYRFDEALAHMYSLDLTLDVAAHTLSGSAKVLYRNQCAAELAEAAFHLYPNAYSKSPPMDAGRYCPDGFDPGYIKLSAASVDGIAVSPRLDTSATMAFLPLKTPLRPGGRAQIELEFTTKLPSNRMRFGHYGQTYSVTSAYPIAAVPGANGRWPDNPYPRFGDPFFATAAIYDVVLRVPKGYVVAAGAQMLSETAPGAQRALRLYSPGMREFAFCASSRYEVYKQSAKSGVEVELYADPELDAQTRRHALTAAVKALNIFEKRFGPYPFSRLSVAQSGILDGGMEYPGLVLIDATLFGAGYEHFLEHIVVHEVAHQWWYALVGSDQFTQPWVDEALTEYSTFVYYEDRYDKARADAMFEYFVEHSYGGAMNGRGGGMLSDYKDAVDYSANVYARGAKMYAKLRAQMGERAFFAALKEYAAKNAYGIADGGVLIEALKAHGGDVGIVEGYLRGEA